MIYLLVDKWIRPRLRKKIIEKYGSIEDWDTCQITNMTELFMWKYNFNDDISQWNIEKVRDMREMFGFTSDNGTSREWKIHPDTLTQDMFLKSSDDEE